MKSFMRWKDPLVRRTNYFHRKCWNCLYLYNFGRFWCYYNHSINTLRWKSTKVFLPICWSRLNTSPSSTTSSSGITWWVCLNLNKKPQNTSPNFGTNSFWKLKVLLWCHATLLLALPSPKASNITSMRKSAWIHQKMLLFLNRWENVNPKYNRKPTHISKIIRLALRTKLLSRNTSKRFQKRSLVEKYLLNQNLDFNYH